MPAAKIAQPMATAAANPARAAKRVAIAGPLDDADREQEQDGLEPFARDGDEREPGQGGHRTGRESDVDAVLELALHGPSLAPHPEEHPGQHHDRKDRGETFEALLDDERQAPDRRDDEKADGNRDGQRRPDADPDATQRIPALELDQIGADDPDDQGGFQPLAEQR